MAERVLEPFLEACRLRRGCDVTDALRQRTEAFQQRAARDATLLSRAAEALEGLPPAGAAWVALTLGTAIEGGADVGLTGPALLRYFKARLRRLPVPPADPSPAGAATDSRSRDPSFEVFRELCQAVVAHLARMPDRREKLALDQPLLQRLQELERCDCGAVWVLEALCKTSGTLLALHPQTQQGVRLAYANISNCFHLFSLVQAAIGRRLAGGRTPNSAIVAAARGQNGDPIWDEAWWHYGDPRCSKPDLAASVWGEALVRSLPLVDGARVVLLWPRILESRTWHSGFFSPHLEALPADVTLECKLPRREARARLKQLGIECARPWWRLW